MSVLWNRRYIYFNQVGKLFLPFYSLYLRIFLQNRIFYEYFNHIYIFIGNCKLNFEIILALKKTFNSACSVISICNLMKTSFYKLSSNWIEPIKSSRFWFGKWKMNDEGVLWFLLSRQEWIAFCDSFWVSILVRPS